ncbi:MAG: molecular chaperone HtpG [Verrucomicrobiales bacterium]
MTEGTQQAFQAEVRQLLDIVIHSLYTDKEIFVRELISNASDALEKMRLKQLTEKGIFDEKLPLEINISTDDTAKTITIADYGIGMTREELVENLGTIARSGSKEFLQAMQEKGEGNASVIGQFGVGFYSAFMVAEKVEVYTHSWQPEGGHWKWSSDGKSGFSVEETEGQRRGAKIVVYLQDEFAEFSKAETVKGIVERYSKFVSFPVHLNGEHQNTVEALWLKNKSEVSEEDYKEFYQYCAHAIDEPRHTLHFSADAPLNLNALLFTPQENQERFGMGQMKPGVALYCRKVLIDQNPEGLLPEWLRFLRGVVDSEDLPLNISRESMQDSALVQKINRLLTKRFLKHLAKQAKNEPEKYAEFFERFGRFIREGIAVSFEHHDLLAPLLRFESSLEDAGKLTSLPDYVERMKEGQEEIYYLVGADRETIENGPYVEAFKKRGLEVAYFTDQVDDYVLETLREFKGKKLVSADRGGIELEEVADEESGGLSKEDSEELVAWLNQTLEGKVERVDAGQRLVSHPLVALTPEDAPSGQVRAMMEAMGQEAPEVKARLEVNPRHELIGRLFTLKGENEELAAQVARQLTDNALISAGLVKNPAQVLRGMTELVGELLKR